MPLTMHGHWRLRVRTVVSNPNDRLVVTGADSGNGTFPLTSGVEIEASGVPEWSIEAQLADANAPGGFSPIELVIEEQDRTLASLPTEIRTFNILTTGNGNILSPRGDIIDGTFIGQMMDVPYRPFAVRESDLFELPDGVFDTSLGTCLMGVRIRNTWGRALSFAVHSITEASRASLAARGIGVIREFSTGRLGHGTIFDWPAHQDLQPGQSVTSFFKLDLGAAVQDKHEVEFFAWDRPWAVKDAGSTQRRVTKTIFVSRSSVDQLTGELVNEVPEGTFRVFMREMAIDGRGARNARRRKPSRSRPGHGSGGRSDDLRRLLKGWLDGENVNPCAVLREWQRLCCDSDDGRGGRLPPVPGILTNDRFSFDPFYAVPTKLRYTVRPNVPFPGQFGPLPYNDPYWKLALLILAFLLWIAGLINQASDNAYNEDKLVIGDLWKWQADDLDVALTVLNGSRSIPSPLTQAANVRPDEVGIRPVETPNGFVIDPIDYVLPIMTKAEVEDLRMLPMDDPGRKVFKSGARTGVTHGIIKDVLPWSDPRKDDGVVFDIDQLLVVQDPSLDPPEPVSRKGDSGSIWVHEETLRPIALHHSGNPEDTRAWGSFLEDIAARFNVIFD